MRHTAMALLLGFLGTLASACGSSGMTEEESCRELVSLQCNKTYSCGDLAALAVFGAGHSSVADCITNESAICSMNICYTSGLHYQSSQASRCIADTDALSCTDFIGHYVAASCASVCK